METSISSVKELSEVLCLCTSATLCGFAIVLSAYYRYAMFCGSTDYRAAISFSAIALSAVKFFSK